MSKRVSYLILVGLLVTITVALIYLLFCLPNTSHETMGEVEKIWSPPKSREAREWRSIDVAPDGRKLLPEAADLARTLNAPEGSAEQDRQTLTTLVDLFRRANHGAIPAGGLNEEITEQLLDRNAQHVAVLPPDCPGLDAQSRLLDRWGTPYFLHPLSREILEIRSAGPDRKWWTQDDVSDPTMGEGIQR